VAYHDAVRTCADAAGEGHGFHSVKTVAAVQMEDQLVVAVLGGVTVAGEVLQAGDDSLRGEASHLRFHHECYGVGAERAVADYAVGRVAPDVGPGGEVHVNAQKGQVAASFGRTGLCAEEGGLAGRSELSRSAGSLRKF